MWQIRAQACGVLGNSFHPIHSSPMYEIKDISQFPSSPLSIIAIAKGGQHRLLSSTTYLKLDRGNVSFHFTLNFTLNFQRGNVFALIRNDGVNISLWTDGFLPHRYHVPI